MNWQATLLAEDDNVATVLRPIAAGEVVSIRTPTGLSEVVAVESIPLCHKIALADLAAGQDVRKYGFCIGEARTAIRRGAWVHVHNLASRRAQPRESAAQ